MDGGGRIRADFVIGADGATSHVAHRAGLVDEARVLWGFAVRCYVDQRVDLPAITLWEQTPWHAFPGYGWIFPGPDGVANVGLGVGTLADRQSGSAAVRVLPAYLRYLADRGLLDRVPDRTGPRRLGGWLKMGMVGTVPAAGRVLLVGGRGRTGQPPPGGGHRPGHDQRPGRGRGRVGLPGPGGRRATGASWPSAHLPYQRITAAGHAALVGRPRAVAAVGRLLTAPLVGRALAGGWGIFWNELLDGAAPGAARRVAVASTWTGPDGHGPVRGLRLVRRHIRVGFVLTVPDAWDGVPVLRWTDERRDPNRSPGRTSSRC